MKHMVTTNQKHVRDLQEIKRDGGVGDGWWVGRQITVLEQQFKKKKKERKRERENSSQDGSVGKCSTGDSSTTTSKLQLNYKQPSFRTPEI